MSLRGPLLLSALLLLTACSDSKLVDFKIGHYTVSSIMRKGCTGGALISGVSDDNKGGDLVGSVTVTPMPGYCSIIPTTITGTSTAAQQDVTSGKALGLIP